MLEKDVYCPESNNVVDLVVITSGTEAVLDHLEHLQKSVSVMCLFFMSLLSLSPLFTPVK
jgi:uncharacterized membrane protein